MSLRHGFHINILRARTVKSSEGLSLNPAAHVTNQPSLQRKSQASERP